MPVNGLELFTEEDASYLSSIIGKAQATEPTVIELSAEELAQTSLDYLASALHGISDPIGQLKSWLYDRLKELTSWFADTVRALFNEAYSTLFQPILTSISNTVQSIWNYLSQVPGALKDFIQYLADIIKDALSDIINNLIPQIANALQNLASTVGNVVDSIASTIRAKIGDILNNVVSTIENTLSTITSKLSDIGNTIFNAVQQALSRVGNVVQSVISDIQSTLNSIVAQIQNVGNTIAGAISNIVNALESIPARIADILRTIGDYINSYVVQPLKNLASEALNTLRNAISDVVNFVSNELLPRIRDFGTQVLSTLESIARTISDKIVSAVEDALSRIAGIIEQALRNIYNFVTQDIPNALRSLLDNILSGISKVSSFLYNNVIEPIASRIRDILSSLSGYLEMIFSFIENRIPSLVNNVVNRLAKDIGNVLGKLGQFAEQAFNTINKAFRDITSRIYDFLSKELPNAITTIENMLVKLPDKVWESLQIAGQKVTEFFAKIFKDIVAGLNKMGQLLDQTAKHLKLVGVALMGFSNAVAHLPSALHTVFKEYLDKLVSGLNTIADFFKTIKDFLAKAGEKLKDIVVEYIAKPALSGLKELASILETGLSKAWDVLTSIATFIFDKISSLVSKIGGIILDAVTTIYDKVSGAVDKVLDALIRPAIEKLRDYVLERIGEVLERSLKGSKRTGEAWLFWELASTTYQMFPALVAPGYFLKEGSQIIEEVTEEVSAEPLGAGIAARIKANLGRLVKWLGETLNEINRALLEGYVIGIGLSFFDPYKYAIRPIAKRFLTPIFERTIGVDAFFELPSISMILEFLRRALPTKILPKNVQGIEFKPYMKWEDAKKYVSGILETYGLPDKFTDLFKLDINDYYIVFIDRFGKPRKLPLAPVFELMTHSELTRMIQKDIFPAITVAQAVAALRGWSQDLTTMEYLLTFKYPSFEKLWKFYMRATAGLLWFNPPETIQEVFAREAQTIGAGVPVPPLKLQSAITGADALKAFETAINTYFKWIEYSNFSWFTPKTELYGVRVGEQIYNTLGGWSADSWIMADVAADIPTKIDLRWMSRYGIFLWLADKLQTVGVQFNSYAPLVTIIPKILDQNASSKIEVHLEWFSKLLQATGLHPAWVPIVTAAENIMVIADEMTLLRTGWLNLFKEGLLTVDDVEQYLRGILTVSYRVGYWDLETKSWNTAYINLPVMWLPHERRLLELRMAIDRALSLYREVEKVVVSAVKTLSITPSDAMKLLTQAIELVDAHYSSLAKDITGKEMHIELDTAYEQLRLQLFKMLQGIEVKERLRYWWYRVSGWLLYRIAYGYVTTEDIDNVLNTIAEVVPLFPQEVEGYKKILDAIHGIVAKESIPTPSQLATMAELMPINKTLVEEVLVKRNIPEQFRPLWRRYIELKPLKNEFDKVVSAYYKALKKGVAIPDELKREVDKWFKAFNVTKEELELLNLAAQLEQLTEGTKETIPTPTQVATLAEYIEVPDKLIQEAIEAHNIPKEWAPIWVEYIHVKPFKTDFKKLLNTAIKAYLKGVIAKDKLEKLFKEAPSYGFTKKELDILNNVVELEELIERAKEKIPTPSQLATLAEYIAIPENLINETLEYWHIPPEWRQIWLRYIETKPLKSDYKRFLSIARKAYLHGLIDNNTWNRLVNEALNYGFRKEEIELIINETKLLEELEKQKVYMPTPSMLATLAEYVVIPEKLVDEVFSYRHVPSEWVPIWKAYIYRKPLGDEARFLLSRYLRILAHGYKLPPAVDEKVKKLLEQLGVTSEELSIRELAISLEEYEKRLPTLSGLITLAEYVEVPKSFVEKVLAHYNLDTEYQKLWEKYFEARTISREAYAVLSVFKRLFERFTVPRTIVDKVRKLLAVSGWTSRELEVLGYELELRKQYRTLATLIPTIRGFLADSRYLPNWEQLFEQILAIRGIDVDKYKEQIEYYKTLAKNRMVWRQIAYYRSTVIRAYAYGVIDKNQLIARLQALKKYGLSDEEIKLLVDAAELERQRRQIIETHHTRYG